MSALRAENDPAFVQSRDPSGGAGVISVGPGMPRIRQFLSADRAAHNMVWSIVYAVSDGAAAAESAEAPVPRDFGAESGIGGFV